MFSLSHVIRVFIVTAITTMAAFFCALTAIDVMLEPYWKLMPVSNEEVYRQIYVWMIVMALAVAVFGVVTFIFFYNRGLNKYQEFLRRVANINFSGKVRPDVLRFPKEDEFGNLGAQLNALIEKLAFYDQSKTAMALAEKEKFNIVADNAHFPILIFNRSMNEPQVSYYNRAYKELFLKKSTFIDHTGKTQTRYYNMEDAPLNALNIRIDEAPPFFDERQCSWIRYPAQGGENMQVLRNMKFRSFSGEKSYIFGEVIFVPIQNRVENITSQVLYVFLNPKLDDRPAPKANTASAVATL